ncbi:NAD(P)-binding domain-containing protein [Streptomyces sp. NPDC126499]|uniref:NAD(P)-binding domain-containing protein n=1 Tax=Streptomyces sp. NPDC126499 TaxID=3155314 RepID=UPI00332B33DD
MRVGIIGAGAMGRAMARRAALAGAVVLLADRGAGHATGRARRVAREAMAGTPGVVTAVTPRAALRTGLVILALDRGESVEFVRRHRRTLTGKVLVEVTVPRAEPHGTRMGDLMAAAPGARWVRACAAGDAESIHRGLIDGHPVDVFVAADDVPAKIRVIELADRSGLRALDAGRIDRAGVLDELTSLGREISHRLATPEGWAIKLLPSW